MGIRRHIELWFATLGALILAAVVTVIVQESFGCSPTSELVERLRSPDSGAWTRRRVAVCLAQASISTQAQWTAVFEGLNDSDEQVRRRMVTILMRVPLRPEQFDSDAARPALLNALRSADPRVQLVAIQYLQYWRRSANLPAIAAVYENPRQDAIVRRAAGRALTEIGDASTVPSLVKVLRDPDPGIRGAAARRLEEIGPRAVAAIPVLSQILDDRKPEVSAQFARALGALAECAPGDAADTAVAALVKQLREGNDFPPAMLNMPARPETDRDQFMRMAIIPSPARAALMRIGPAAIPPMIAAADDDNVMMRMHAASALGHLLECPRTNLEDARRQLYHVYAPTTVPKLLRLMNDDSRALRGEATSSLQMTIRYADDMPEVMALIARARQDESPWVREGVEKALAEEARFAEFKQRAREAVKQKALANQASLAQTSQRSTR